MCGKHKKRRKLGYRIEWRFVMSCLFVSNFALLTIMCVMIITFSCLDHRIERCLKHGGITIQHAKEFIQAHWTRDEYEYKSMKCVMSLHYVKTVEDQREKFEKELAKYCEGHLYSYL